MNNDSIIAIGGLALMLWWLRQGSVEAEALIDRIRDHIRDLRGYGVNYEGHYSGDQLRETNVYLTMKSLEDYWTDHVLKIEADPSKIKVDDIPEIVRHLYSNYETYAKNLAYYTNELDLVEKGQERHDGIFMWKEDKENLLEILGVFEDGITLAQQWRDFIYNIQEQLAGKDSANQALEHFDELRRSYDVRK